VNRPPSARVAAKLFNVVNNPGKEGFLAFLVLCRPDHSIEDACIAVDVMEVDIISTTALSRKMRPAQKCGAGLCGEQLAHLPVDCLIQ
jgi:hypothetical protein